MKEAGVLIVSAAVCVTFSNVSREAFSGGVQVFTLSMERRKRQVKPEVTAEGAVT